MGSSPVDEVVQEALATEDGDVRIRLLGEGLVDHGTEFVLAVGEASDALTGELAALLEHWFGGGRLSARADEPERRVHAAQELHELVGEGSTGRWFASSMLELPPGHELRDVALATSLLKDGIASARRDDDADEELRTIAVQVGNNVGGDAQLDALVARGDELAQSPDVDAEPFLDAVQVLLLGRVRRAEEDRDNGAAERWTEELRERTSDRQSDLDRALELQAAGEHAAAAECWARIVDANDLADSAIQQFALEEARCLVRADSLPQAVDVLERAIGYSERDYVQAVRPEDIDDAGDRVGTMATLLALARANMGAWDRVAGSLDRGRALRLRYLADVKASPNREIVFGLEREIERCTRLAKPADELAELLERHRTALRDIDVPLPRSPTTQEVAAALPEGEAVAILALHPTATVGAVIVPGDEEPSGQILDPDWDHDAWMELFIDEGDRAGWASVLAQTAAGSPPTEPPEGLERLMRGADEAVGGMLRDLLEEHGITRLTIVTGELLLLIPWWALPSLAGIDVVMASTLADVVARQPDTSAAARSALLVSNPTGDARTTSLASIACGATLSDVGVAVAAVDGADATPSTVTAALDGVGLLHFAGHGRWTQGQGVLELSSHGVADADRDLVTTRPQGDQDRLSDDERHLADPDELWLDSEWQVPDVGIVHERVWLAGPRVDRWLEGQDSTLMATYRDEQLLRLSRLWSASDMLLGDAFRSCRLCVLTACESAIPGSGLDVTHAGLPGALTVAGVDTVVGTLWPIEERVAAIWTGCFYDQLAQQLEQGRTTVDIAALVRQVAAEVRAMSSAEAAGHLVALLPLSSDPLTSLTLEAEAHTLADQPFQHPWFWASFSVTGSPVLTVKERT